MLRTSGSDRAKGHLSLRQCQSSSLASSCRPSLPALSLSSDKPQAPGSCLTVPFISHPPHLACHHLTPGGWPTPTDFLSGSALSSLSDGRIQRFKTAVGSDRVACCSEHGLGPLCDLPWPPLLPIWCSLCLCYCVPLALCSQLDKPSPSWSGLQTAAHSPGLLREPFLHPAPWRPQNTLSAPQPSLPTGPATRGVPSRPRCALSVCLSGRGGGACGEEPGFGCGASGAPNPVV